MSCGGGGSGMSLCPDTRVNKVQELVLDRLASSHVYHSAVNYCTHQATAKGKDHFTHTFQLEQASYIHYIIFVSHTRVFLLQHWADKVKYVIIYFFQDFGSSQ